MSNQPPHKRPRFKGLVVKAWTDYREGNLALRVGQFRKGPREVRGG